MEAIIRARQERPELAITLIREISNEVHPSYISMAKLHEALGDEENMYAHLEQVLLHRENSIAFISTSFFEQQDEPRFRDIVARSWVPLQYWN